MIIDYATYLKTPEWRHRARAAKQRAGNRCALCNSDRPLEAHHRTYERIGNERQDDLIVLCSPCHRRHHGIMPQPPKYVAGQLLLPFIAHVPNGQELN
jgi:5-methylcytosine-specific restriction endonuclease McrA